MKTAVVFLSVTVIVAAIAFFWWRSKQDHYHYSFWDAVRNPDALQDLDDFHREVDEAATLFSGSTQKTAQLVDFFVFEAK
ncbi:MAG: hypothetical protein AAF802_18670, partial [Planctomycetota bacterium]